jgi:hypothetical protein
LIPGARDAGTTVMSMTAMGPKVGSTWQCRVSIWQWLLSSIDGATPPLNRSTHMTATATSKSVLKSASTDSVLRFAMRLDATLTGVCGLAVAAFANPLSSMTGLTPTTEYILGAFFVLYGVVVYSLAGLPKVRTAGIAVIVANLVCTLAAALVVVEGIAPLTGLGVAVTLATGVYTAVFAVLQYLGVRRLA